MTEPKDYFRTEYYSADQLSGCRVEAFMRSGPDFAF
jgi:hypothetical protein